MNRVYNFSAGPSMLPMPVLEQAANELVCYGTSGMSVMEMSHRSPDYEAIIQAAEETHVKRRLQSVVVQIKHRRRSLKPIASGSR